MSMARGKHFIIKTKDNHPIRDYIAPMDYTRMVPDDTTDGALPMDYYFPDVPGPPKLRGFDYDKEPTTIDPLYTRNIQDNE